jgi:uncharacterized membrane protein
MSETRKLAGSSLQRVLFGATSVAAAAGVAYLIGRRLVDTPEGASISDAPASAFRSRAGSTAPISQTVTISQPRSELYAFWREFTNLPRFMDNIVSVEPVDEKRSRWVIKAPAGTTIEFVSRITADEVGSLIAWESEQGSDIRNSGRVEFIEAAPGRGTMVRATIFYEAPGGAPARAVAKLLQREPNVQARRDLRRFKQLMETGEITSSASPSGRRSEDPTRQHL